MLNYVSWSLSTNNTKIYFDSNMNVNNDSVSESGANSVTRWLSESF